MYQDTDFLDLKVHNFGKSNLFIIKTISISNKKSGVVILFHLNSYCFSGVPKKACHCRFNMHTRRERSSLMSLKGTGPVMFRC